MTSTADGDGGDSYGWINYRFIEAGEQSQQFNPVGGEERFWIGPEGGAFSYYFKPGAEPGLCELARPGRHRHRAIRHRGAGGPTG